MDVNAFGDASGASYMEEGCYLLIATSFCKFQGQLGCFNSVDFDGNSVQSVSLEVHKVEGTGGWDHIQPTFVISGILGEEPAELLPCPECHDSTPAGPPIMHKLS
mmetsp:Transcript_32207/g.53228  ORF Transcript_32207/g.53228 Transcript_32207/m.53228 type:complete len:105 (-) Transcript_32207:180-494(-)